jgi:hypothetical protein
MRTEPAPDSFQGLSREGGVGFRDKTCRAEFFAGITAPGLTRMNGHPTAISAISAIGQIVVRNSGRKIGFFFLLG